MDGQISASIGSGWNEMEKSYALLLLFMFVFMLLASLWLSFLISLLILDMLLYHMPFADNLALNRSRLLSLANFITRIVS